MGSQASEREVRCTGVESEGQDVRATLLEAPIKLQAANRGLVAGASEKGKSRGSHVKRILASLLCPYAHRRE